MLLSSVAALIWRSLEGAAGSARSIFAGVFTLAWIPFLISFAVLPLHTFDGETPVGLWPDGVVPPGRGRLRPPAAGGRQRHLRALSGASLGKHPMAPKISPQEELEGFAGSIAGATSSVCSPQSSCWTSLVGRRRPRRGHGGRGHRRRPLRIHGEARTRHQGHEQHPPGHGGVMDRLDSIVFACPVAFILFSAFAGA